MNSVAQTIASAGLPLAPVPEHAVPLPVSSVPPPDEPSTETDLIIVVDILLETLGIVGGNQSIAQAIINEDEALSRAIADLLDSVTTHDWESVASSAETFFKLFVGSAIWSRIKEQGVRRISFRLGLRAIPGIGWLYCVASFLISVKNNYSRFSFA